MKLPSLLLGLGRCRLALALGLWLDILLLLLLFAAVLFALLLALACCSSFLLGRSLLLWLLDVLVFRQIDIFVLLLDLFDDLAFIRFVKSLFLNGRGCDCWLYLLYISNDSRT
jgi:hypothetical protein